MRVAMLPPARTRHRLSPGYPQLSRPYWIQVRFGRVKDPGAAEPRCLFKTPGNP